MVSVCTARRIARSIASSVCKKPMASSIASAATTDIDQLLLDGTNAAHYTTAEWAGYEHLLRDAKPTVGTLRTPRAGRCWLFDGTNDYAARADSNLRPTGDFTITLWIKTDWTATDDGIVGAWSTTGYMLARDSGFLRCYRDTNYASSSLNLNTAGYSNTWIHLAVVANGTSCKFYVNGSQFGTTQTFPTSTQAANGGVPFLIGAYGGPQGEIAASIRDVRLYGVAKSDSEIAAIANQASTPGTYDTTGLLGAWWCEEESGTTGYDWSGNGRNLTLTNITQATFHASDTGVTYSDANVRGYRLSGSVYIPAQSSTLAADGNALTVTGKCPQPGYAPQKCITPDGVNDYATAGNGIGNALGGSFTAICVSAWCYLSSAGNGGVFFIGSFGTGGKVSLFTFGGSAYFRLNGSSDANSSTGMSVGRWSHIAGTWDGTTQRLYVNGVQTASIAFSTALSATATQSILGTYNDTVYNWPGRFCDVRVFSVNKTQAQIQAIMAGGTDTTGLLAHWPCCEGPGSSNTNTTIYDVSGNARHATITNATIASYWTNSTTYDSGVHNYPLKYGYTIDGSGVVVPAKLDGLLDAAGNAIGQAAGGWANGLPNLNCLPYTNPLGVSVGLETSLDPTADRKTTSSSKRRRRNTSGRYDRFGARSTAMSDASSNAYFGD